MPDNSHEKSIDWKLCDARAFWRNNAPRCLDDSHYQNWLEWGKRLYKDDIKLYRTIVELESRDRMQRMMFIDVT